MIKRFLAGILLFGYGWFLIGCASEPQLPVAGYSPTTGEKAATTAVSMIDRPYKYRGVSPAGFDCSGLVRYSYLSAGIDVPHGTKELKNVTSPVDPGGMRKGDLLFFNERGRRYSHVGIYLENDLFVHAPGRHGKVRKDSLQDPHWKKSFIEARRLN
ncbi:MAG TPA: C40 family peptidase [Syntrophales bacterium]|nr:C40 family peptidase [Syntrophales bacterium]